MVKWGERDHHLTSRSSQQSTRQQQEQEQEQRRKEEESLSLRLRLGWVGLGEQKCLEFRAFYNDFLVLRTPLEEERRRRRRSDVWTIAISRREPSSATSPVVGYYEADHHHHKYSTATHTNSNKARIRIKCYEKYGSQPNTTPSSDKNMMFPVIRI